MRGRSPRSTPENRSSETVSGSGSTAERIVAGSAPMATATGMSSPRARPGAMVRRAAAMLEPAQDRAVRAERLHPVDADVHSRRVVGRSSGGRVSTSGQVISGAASPGQQVWIGSLPRSTSAPMRWSCLAIGPRDDAAGASTAPPPPSASATKRRASRRRARVRAAPPAARRARRCVSARRRTRRRRARRSRKDWRPPAFSPARAASTASPKRKAGPPDSRTR